MGVHVTFINPSIPHKAETSHADWSFEEAVKRHKPLPSGRRYFIHTNECVIIGTEKDGTIQMDASKPHWILEKF